MTLRFPEWCRVGPSGLVNGSLFTRKGRRRPGMRLLIKVQRIRTLWPAARNPQSLHRLKEDSLEGFASEPEEPGGERFGFLKISAIRETGPERVEVELELTPAAAREPIDLESLGLRDIQISTRESKSGGRSVWLTGSGTSLEVSVTPFGYCQ